ncbi:FUSC family protein [Gordonia sp. NPDC003376]
MSSTPVLPASAPTDTEPARSMRGDAVRHWVRAQTWRDIAALEFARIGYAVPIRVGVAVALVMVVGGLTGHRDVAGLAALGALISAFCRPDPYPVRLPRLLVIGAALTASVAIGGTLGTYSSSTVVNIIVISLLGGASVYLMTALHIVGPGAVIIMFAANGAAASVAITGIGHATAATAIGAAVGILASIAPWLLGLARTEAAAPRRESLRMALAGGHTRAAHRHLLYTAGRITVAAAIAGGAAAAIGLAHPMWAAMGGVAAMQGVAYHLTVRRGVQRLIGNVIGGVIAAVLLALPLGYWGAVVAIVIFQIAAEIFSTVNYALCSVVVTPMALLLTGIGSHLSPDTAVDRVLDTLIGIVIGIVIAAITITRADVAR